MQIAPFGVEQWMNEYETRCRHNLAETCCDSITVEELLQLSGQSPEHLHELLGMKLTYGAIEGSDRLRSAIAALYEHQTGENTLVTHGAIGANQLAYLALIEPGDHVVSVVPSYQQHTSIPESLGANVTRVPLREEHGWQLDVDELVGAITPGTKVVSLTNQVIATRGIVSSPTKLESSSLVFSYGLDCFFAVVQPSNAFDTLPPGFNYPTMYVSVIGVFAALIFTTKMAARKELKERWA